MIGTFDGLPEGATVSVGGKTFAITYRGGDGNDVVLKFRFANDDSYIYIPNQTLTVAASGVLGNDLDPAVPLKAVLVTPTSHGAISLSPNGGFVYTPLLGSTAPDQFTYLFVDAQGHRSNVATVTLLPMVCPPPSVTANALGAVEMVADTFAVATVTSMSAPARATITWPEGTTVTAAITSLGNCAYAITASNSFPEEGTFSYTLAVTDALGNATIVTAPLIVSDAALSSSGTILSGIEGAALSNVIIGTLHDANPNPDAADFLGKRGQRPLERRQPRHERQPPIAGRRRLQHHRQPYLRRKAPVFRRFHGHRPRRKHDHRHQHHQHRGRAAVGPGRGAAVRQGRHADYRLALHLCRCEPPGTPERFHGHNNRHLGRW